ncbi:MAG TPA: signal peptidase I [Candidatus Omnitrophota bacterium]|nr:signal peptidase I [Candidatus Omnitrophota bacterium]HPD84033.1 signal peptidase I [Candidatus Omnitrophota bacterium]HRZ02890.1 signal peptidase I [Candidatus Omnitrophota bacterium]
MVPLKITSRNKAVIREWVESIVVALLLAIFIRTFFVQAFKIPSGSMRTTLLEGDRILVNKLRYGPKIPFTKMRLPGFTKPKRGDVIVFVYPEDPKKDFVKRLIALGGETVEIKDGHLYVDNRLVEDQPIHNIYYYNRGDYGETNQIIKVPEHTYYVLGDNSGSSKDSRYWGFVPEELLIGRAELIYWPLTRIRIVK